MEENRNQGESKSEWEERESQLLRLGWDELDRLVDTPRPNREWFQQLVTIEKRKQRKRLFKELLLFWAVSATMFPMVLILVGRMTLGSIVLTQVILAVMPTVLLIKKEVVEVDRG